MSNNYKKEPLDYQSTQKQREVKNTFLANKKLNGIENQIQNNPKDKQDQSQINKPPVKDMSSIQRTIQLFTNKQNENKFRQQTQQSKTSQSQNNNQEIEQEPINEIQNPQNEDATQNNMMVDTNKDQQQINSTLSNNINQATVDSEEQHNGENDKQQLTQEELEKEQQYLESQQLLIEQQINEKSDVLNPQISQKVEQLANTAVNQESLVPINNLNNNMEFGQEVQQKDTSDQPLQNQIIVQNSQICGMSNQQDKESNQDQYQDQLQQQQQHYQQQELNEEDKNDKEKKQIQNFQQLPLQFDNPAINDGAQELLSNQQQASPHTFQSQEHSLKSQEQQLEQPQEQEQALQNQYQTQQRSPTNNFEHQQVQFHRLASFEKNVEEHIKYIKNELNQLQNQQKSLYKSSSFEALQNLSHSDKKTIQQQIEQLTIRLQQSDKICKMKKSLLQQQHMKEVSSFYTDKPQILEKSRQIIQQKSMNNQYQPIQERTNQIILKKQQKLAEIKSECLKEQEEKIKECTFEPDTSSSKSKSSKYLLTSKQQKRSEEQFYFEQQYWQMKKDSQLIALRQQQEENMDDKLTFVPQIDQKSKQIANTQRSKHDTQCKQWQQNVSKKIEKIKQKLQPSFHPIISPNSRRIIEQKKFQESNQKQSKYFN